MNCNPSLRGFPCKNPIILRQQAANFLTKLRPCYKKEEIILEAEGELGSSQILTTPQYQLQESPIPTHHT